MGNRKKVQVKKEHYSKGYDDLYRWVSYWTQVDTVKDVTKGKILEIGVGNKTVSNYLKNNGFNLTTCDIDSDLKPDFVSDITDLPFKGNSFSTVLCCEVLEHLPYDRVKKALREINRVTRDYAVISIFAANVGFSFAFKIPFLKLVYSSIKIPMFWEQHKFNGEHYWEIGKKGYSLNKVRKLIDTANFKIITEEFSPLNIYHRFFVLRKMA